MLELNIKNLSNEDRVFLINRLGCDRISFKSPYPYTLTMKGTPVGTLTDFELKIDTAKVRVKFPEKYYSVL